MQLPRSKSATLLFAIGLLLVSAAYLGWKHPWRNIDNRVYRIGWQQVPPFQQKGADASPTGLAVELVRDAARRRGIRLEWVFYPGSAEKALRNRELDLWVMMTILPERKGIVHISQPYLQHDTVLLVHADSAYTKTQDLTSAAISHFDLPINQLLLRRILPNARLLPKASLRDAIEDVCAKRTDAAFADEVTGITALLAGPSCASQPLRVIPLPMLRITLGIGSTLEMGMVADEIRRGMDASTQEGDLARTLTSWGYFSPHNMEYISALSSAQRREQWLIATVAVFAGLLALTVVGANRIRRQRDRIELAEGALRHSEQKLRLMAHNLTEMVLAYDMNRCLVFANPAVERLTGYSSDELQKQKFVCWIHPEDRSRMFAYWDKLFQGGAYGEEQYRLITKHGQMKWVAATWGPIYDDTGRQIGVQGSEREITESKLAEQALRNSEHRFRELLEGVQLVALMIDVNGMIGFCNDYALAITGWTSEEVIGRPAKELLDTECLRQLAGELPSSELAGPPQPFFEGGILAKNGSRRWIQWSSTPLRDSAGRAAGFASLGADVTELQTLRAEAARRESDERFRNMADTAPLMVWVAGPDKGCTFVNKGWLTFTGRTLDQELGNGWTAGLHPDDLDYCFNTYSSAFDARRSFQVEYRLRRADGEYRWVLGSGAPRFGPEGDFAGYVGNCTDITDLKRSQEEDVSRQKLESVGRLAGGIAHDFNNLLGGVLAQADLAIEELASGARPDEELNRIRAVAINGAGIVRQLMIYAGQENAVSGPVDLSTLIAEMMDLLNVVVSKHATLRTELGGGLPTVAANPAQLRQLVMNLVTNASEAIGEQDGLITIRTARGAASLDSSPGGAGEFVQLEIQDTGCGMSLDAQARVFDPFFTTKSAGHGLGLAVVQGIVRGLGGAIHLESESGRGAKFRILLPSAGQMAPPARPESASLTPEGRNHSATILVVEDEAPLRLAVTRFLRMKGFSVIEAADGTVALNLVREYKDAIALVLLDITLPGVPSRDVFAEACRVRPDMKVIVTSAYGQNTVDASFPGLRVDCFIRKPFQLVNLVSMVSKVLAA